MKRCTLHPPSSWNKRYLTQIVIRERNEIESARTIPLTTLFHESLSLSLLYPQLPFSPLKNEKCLFRNVRTVSSRFDAFIWEFIMMSQLRRSFAYSNNERWDKKIKKMSRYRVQRVYEQSKERRKRKIERDFRGIRKHARRIMLYIPWSNSGRAFSTNGDPTFPPHACFFPSLISRREFS